MGREGVVQQFWGLEFKEFRASAMAAYSEGMFRLM